MGSRGSGACCKQFAKFLFSHVGLCGMVVLYCVVGGFIFEHLEKKNEEEICYESRSEYQPMETKTVNSTMKIFFENGGIVSDANRETMEVQLRSVLETFRNNTLAIGYDGRDCDRYGLEGGPKYEWTWAGALMFSVTVVTTIGYGHIAPKTIWGRLVCIAYAVLGIPLMLLCLANIGDVLADIFRFIYAKICCCACCRKRKSRERRIQALKQQQEQNQQGQIIPKNSESLGDGEVIKSDKSTIITNNVPPTNTEFSRLQSKSPSESLEGDKQSRPSSASSTTKLRPVTPPTRSIKIVPLDVKTLSHNRPTKTEPPVIVDDDSSDEDDDDYDLDDKKITVPLTITMIVIGSYIFAGAVLFGLWEGWDWLQSAYFCFITLATIGFGDVVPGTDFENPTAQAQLLLGSVYVLFGMAILSMCFSLMQEEIVSKCRWIGQKLGILDRTDD